MRNNVNNMDFKGFFVEMQTTDNEKNLIREIISNLVNYNKEWLDDKKILVGDKGNYWILNYSNFGKNEHNRLVRGMVVKKPNRIFNGDLLSLIVSFPFTRFFNQAEPDAAPVDMVNSHMIEKLDGTMIGVHFDDNRIFFHTRKMHSSHETDMKMTQTSFLGLKNEFMPTIKKYVDKLNFNEQDADFTYVFEFIHEISHVVTKYTINQYGLYLLAARNLSTHKELDEHELDEVVKRIKAKRPRTFDAVADQKEIEKMFLAAAAETPDFEGFVFRDKKTGQRIKVKDVNYVKKHHILDKTKIENLIQIIFLGEEEEVTAYFPHAKENVKIIKSSIDSYVEEMTKKALHYKSLNLSKKDLAALFFGQDILPKWERRLKKQTRVEPKIDETKFNINLILALILLNNEREMKDKIIKTLKEVALGQGDNNGTPKNLIEILNIKAKDAETME